MPPVPPQSRAPAERLALRHIAEQAARAGGEVARRAFRTDCGVRLKADRSEVSDADEAAQAAVVSVIRTHRPHDAFIAEETLRLPDGAAVPPPPNADRVCWVIDPIDGTRNFVRGIPLYACCVAAMLDGRPICGAICVPEHERLYSATHPGALLVDGQPQPARGPAAARPAGFNPKPVVAIPSSPGVVASIAHDWLDRYVCRSLGSTALHLLLVATGELDAALADNPRLWDVAAGWALLYASGGTLTTPDGQPLFPLDVSGYAGQALPCIAASAAFAGLARR